ncbi:hypothetical protein SKAU_G00218510 [Synaphobranchus kaupii]|uniref:Uncharacterized protein n=1 Tax=Synaphobranchus kaupii TaxID=118154 RepID=A0A9Q1FA98_SYNKA|nr:hypothetical protein SKAU_G00218510 [Synaphobranchus kaupii]
MQTGSAAPSPPTSCPPSLSLLDKPPAHLYTSRWRCSSHTSGKRVTHDVIASDLSIRRTSTVSLPGIRADQHRLLSLHKNGPVLQGKRTWVWKKTPSKKEPDAKAGFNTSETDSTMAANCPAGMRDVGSAAQGLEHSTQAQASRDEEEAISGETSLALSKQMKRNADASRPRRKSHVLARFPRASRLTGETARLTGRRSIAGGDGPFKAPSYGDISGPAAVMH